MLCIKLLNCIKIIVITAALLYILYTKFVYDLRFYYAHACRCKRMTTSTVHDINDTTFVKTKLRVLPGEEVYL